MCYGSVKDLKALVVTALGRCEGSYLTAVAQLMKEQLVTPKALELWGAKPPPLPLAPLVAPQRAERLFLAGTVVHAQLAQVHEQLQHPLPHHMLTGSDHMERLFVSGAEHFGDVVVTASMLSDHMPGSYEEAIDNAIRDIEHSRAPWYMRLWHRISRTASRWYALLRAPYLRAVTALVLGLLVYWIVRRSLNGHGTPPEPLTPAFVAATATAASS